MINNDNDIKEKVFNSEKKPDIKKNDNSLAVCYPEIAAEWHPTKNGDLTPDKVNKSGGKLVWWLGKCGHEWQMKINARAFKPYIQSNGKMRKGQGCPICCGKRLLTGFNDLQTKNPELAKEWHPTKNGSIKPTDIMAGSTKKVWWLGKCGHEWQTDVNHRNRGTGCPICKKKKHRT